VLWRKSLQPSGKGWDDLSPESMTSLASALNNLSIALIEATPSLIVSPGSKRSIGFLQNVLQGSNELRDRPVRPADVERLRSALLELIPGFGKWQQEEVGLLIDGLVTALRNLAGTLGEAAETQGHAIESLASIHQNLERARRSTDIGEIKEALLSEIASAKRLLDEQTSLQRSLATNYDSSVQDLEERLEKAEEASQTDHLTMLANRAAFDYYGEAIVQKTKHGEGRYSLAMVDLDEFKLINDGQGHIAGDLALNHFAGLLKQHMGQGTFIARFGGDEFVVVLSGGPEALSRRPGMLLRVACKKPARVTQDGTTYIFKLAFSAGVTQVMPDDTIATALSRADSNLYAAKQCGKARVTQDDQRQAA